MAERPADSDLLLKSLIMPSITVTIEMPQGASPPAPAPNPPSQRIQVPETAVQATPQTNKPDRG